MREDGKNWGMSRQCCEGGVLWSGDSCEEFIDESCVAVTKTKVKRIEQIRRKVLKRIKWFFVKANGTQATLL